MVVEPVVEAAACVLGHIERLLDPLLRTIADLLAEAATRTGQELFVVLAIARRSFQRLVQLFNEKGVLILNLFLGYLMTWARLD